MAAYCMFDIPEMLSQAARDSYWKKLSGAVARLGGTAQKSGPWSAAIIEFEDIHRVSEWYASAEYSQIRNVLVTPLFKRDETGSGTLITPKGVCHELRAR